MTLECYSASVSGYLSKRQNPGLNPKTFARPVQWQIDQDYLDRLSPEEKAWLARFNDTYYGGKSTLDPEWPREALREAWRRKNAVRRDEVSKSPPELGLDPERLESEVLDLRATPKYLNLPEYRKALAEYRALLNPYREYKPKDSKALARAKRKLERIVREQEIE